MSSINGREGYKYDVNCLLIVEIIILKILNQKLPTSKNKVTDSLLVSIKKLRTSYAFFKVDLAL